MKPISLHDDQWTKILEFLRACRISMLEKRKCASLLKRDCGCCAAGAQWRLLPSEYGHGTVVYKRFSRWSDKAYGTDDGSFCRGPGMENIMLDSTTCALIRAPPGRQKKRWSSPAGLGA